MFSKSKTLKLIPVMAMEETMNEIHIPELKNKQMCFLNMERKCENEFLYSPWFSILHPWNFEIHILKQVRPLSRLALHKS